MSAAQAEGDLEAQTSINVKLGYRVHWKNLMKLLPGS